MTHIEAVPQPALPHPPTVYYVRENPAWWRVTVEVPDGPYRFDTAYTAAVVDFHAEAYSPALGAWLVARRGPFELLHEQCARLGVPFRSYVLDRPHRTSGNRPESGPTERDGWAA